MNPSIHIHLEHVSKSFPAPDTAERLLALDDVSLTIAPGEFIALVGPSGCGKSTLLRLLAGLDTPSNGRILLNQQSPDHLRQQKQIGWMAQQPALLPWRTVRENITLPALVNSQPHTTPIPAEHLLEMVGLTAFAHAYPHTLSGGMQQRAALARTLAIGAPLWLMDEPFAALDELTREQLATDLLALWRQFRPTVVWVTHHLREAVALADRLVLLSPRPAQIAQVLSVPLPRPRDDTSVAFQDVVRQARATLQQTNGRLPQPAL